MLFALWVNTCSMSTIQTTEQRLWTMILCLHCLIWTGIYSNAKVLAKFLFVTLLPYQKVWRDLLHNQIFLGEKNDQLFTKKIFSLVFYSNLEKGSTYLHVQPDLINLIQHEKYRISCLNKILREHIPR